MDGEAALRRTHLAVCLLSYNGYRSCACKGSHTEAADTNSRTFPMVVAVVMTGGSFFFFF
jgi:hypothetical protein